MNIESLPDVKQFDLSTVDWKARAAKLLRQWKSPSWIDQEDVVQDLLIGAWLNLPKYEPDRGVTLESFILWNATKRAKKRLHRARLGRRPHRGEDRMQSIFELPFSGKEDDHPMWGIQPASVDEKMDAIEQLRCLIEFASTMKEKEIISEVALCAGDLRQAASNLYENPNTRRLLRFGCEHRTLLNVSMTVRRVFARWKARQKSQRLKEQRKQRRKVGAVCRQQV